MKRIHLLTAITALTAAVGAIAQVPSIINYQGRLSASGTNLFNGPGQFKFALVNNGASQTYWSNGVNAGASRRIECLFPGAIRR